MDQGVGGGSTMSNQNRDLAIVLLWTLFCLVMCSWMLLTNADIRDLETRLAAIEEVAP